MRLFKMKGGKPRPVSKRNAKSAQSDRQPKRDGNSGNRDRRQEGKAQKDHHELQPRPCRISTISRIIERTAIRFAQQAPQSI